MIGIKNMSMNSIGHIHFSKKDALAEQQARENRQYLLSKAQCLGNLFHQPVNIVYQADNGEIQQVESVVWSVLEDYMQVTGGYIIPVHAVLAVEL